MDHGLSQPWGNASRGFWTRRRRAAAGLLATLALVAGIALAFKLFEQNVPNNVVRDASNFSFAVEVFRVPSGGGTPAWLAAGPPPLEPIFNENDPVSGTPIEQFPGDTRTQRVRIRNTNTTPARDATFFMYVDQNSIEVRDGAGVLVAPADPRWAQFVNFWTLAVDKEKVLTALSTADLNENDHSLLTDPVDLSDHDRSGFGQQARVCEGGLRSILRTAPCNLGTARKAGSTEVVDNGLQPTDTRWYTFSMREADNGTDQSAFKGWRIRFTMVFQARVPALPEPGLVTER